MVEENMYNAVAGHIKRHYKPGEYVYPDAVRRYNLCSRDLMERILDKLVQDDILIETHAVHCPHCSYLIHYPSPDEDNIIYCPHCDAEISNSSQYCEKYYITKGD